MVVLVASGLWWALVQLDRSTGWLALPSVISPTLVHSAVMAFGFIPLFFSGFLFTASAPKWLGVEAPLAKDLRVPLFSLAAGWLLWLVERAPARRCGMGRAGTGHGRAGLDDRAVLGGVSGAARAEDQLHARVIGTACVVGCVSLAGAVAQPGFRSACDSARVDLHGALGLCGGGLCHRGAPHDSVFTSSAMPMVQAWRPFWVLWLMLAAAALQVLAAWLELAGVPSSAAGTAWLLVHGTLQLMVGGVLVWLAWVWGLVQSLKNKLLAMLHIGFLWLGVAFLLGGVSQWLVGTLGMGVLALGALHALTMGCLRLADAGHGHA